MYGNLLLAIGLLAFLAAAALPESKYQPAGGVLYRISAFFSSARSFIALPLAGVILGVFLEQAIAQTTTAPPAPAPWRTALAQFMIEALAILGPPILAWLGWQANRWFGLNQEAQRREAFQVAVQNAAGKMIQAAGGASRVIAIGTIERNKALHDGLSYLKQAAPDAIEFFQLTHDQLIEKLEAKVGLIVADALGTAGK